MKYDRARMVRVSNIIAGACDISNLNDDYDYAIHEIAHATLLFDRVFNKMQDAISFAVLRMAPIDQNNHEIATNALAHAVTQKLGFTMGRRGLVNRTRASLDPRGYADQRLPQPGAVEKQLYMTHVKPKHIDYMVDLFHSFERFVR